MQFASIARPQSRSAALSLCSQIILRLTDGEPNSAMAPRYRVSRPTASLWRGHNAGLRIAGRHPELNPPDRAAPTGITSPRR